MNLTKRDVESHYSVSDFMIPINEAPHVKMGDLSFKNVLKSIEKGKLGFTVIIDENGKSEGLISNADVRRALLIHLDDLNSVSPEELLNKNPTTIEDTTTVNEMLQLIKNSKFPITYLPVVSKNGFAKGIVTFVNLIKGEL